MKKAYKKNTKFKRGVETRLWILRRGGRIEIVFLKRWNGKKNNITFFFFFLSFFQL